MPTFQFDPGEAESIADYFAAKARQDWYPRYAKTLRLTLGRELSPGILDGTEAHAWDLPRQALQWPVGSKVTVGSALTFDELAARMSADDKRKLTAATLRAIEAGSKPDISANFDKLYSWGSDEGFSMVGPVKEGHELVERRTPSHLRARADFLEVGHEVAIKGVNCYQCHPDPEGKFQGLPIAWAPALETTSRRLREDWVWEWLWSPPTVYLESAMPENFAAPVPQYQDLYPDSTNEEQIQAVMDWLFNLDRPYSR